VCAEPGDHRGSFLYVKCLHDFVPGNPWLIRWSDVEGESIRSQLIDDQQGVPLYLDFQVIDVNTCEPLADTYLEMWSEWFTAA
jgi:protocatechuate 3,4-dioxygenase beta subunit